MEVKYNVSSFDNTPVDRASAGPEVHTGRAVFVDEELYDSDVSYKAKVDKCIEEGFHKVVEGESGGSGGSGGDPGYSCTEEWVTLIDESVTIIKVEESDSYAYASFTYAELITADAIRVTFNGTEYVCENISSLDGEGVYGAPWNHETQSFDWSEYPFSISSYPDASVAMSGVSTETAGTYQVKIEAVGPSVTTTPCFQKAVQSVVGSSSDSSKFVVTFTQDGSTYTADHTYEEVLEAYNSGKVVEGKYGVNAEGETITKVCTLASIDGEDVTFTGIFNVLLANAVSTPYIDAYEFALNINNSVEYTSAVIHSSN